MADFDAKKVTKLMEERATGYASRDTAAKELAKMTGLDLDVTTTPTSALTDAELATHLTALLKKLEQ